MSIYKGKNIAFILFTRVYTRPLDLNRAMKKILFFTLFLSAQIVNAQLSETHENDLYAIDYPEKWTLDQSAAMGMSFIILSPQESADDLFRENINLIEQDLEGYAMNLDQYMDLNLSQLKSFITNYDLKESKRMTGSMEFHKLEYYGSQGQFNLAFVQYFWVIGEKAFVLTFTSEQSQIEKYRQTGEEILQSFKIKRG